MVLVVVYLLFSSSLLMIEKAGGQSATSGTFWGVCKPEKNSVCCLKSAFGMAEMLRKYPRPVCHIGCPI